LPDLDRDHLAVLVFGPGTGELVLVRAPPGAWMVVDGCGAGKDDYAVRALVHYGARPSLIVLTHPHDDHSRGMPEVIHQTTPRDRKEEWPRIGMVLPPGIDVAARSAGIIARRTIEAIAAIESRWHDSPRCRWDMNAGESVVLGDAAVRVMSPRKEVREEELARWARGEPLSDKNVISSALLLTWRGRRVVLGSDLVEHPRHGWTHSLRLDPDLGDHDLLKIAHHGSDRALHDDVLRPHTRVPRPLRTITPFRLQGLPSFSAGEGAHRVASYEGTTYLTGLPRRHARQSGQVEARTLAELATHEALSFTPTTTGFPDCYVAVSIPPDTGPPVVTQGHGSIRIVP
jgi:beta-lactamase superfamily II metal-dependent hydrolase